MEKNMKRFVGKALVSAMLVTATPSWAAGFMDSVGSLTGGVLGGGGGASFSATGTQMQGQLLVGLRSLVIAVSQMNEATGHKAQADKLKAISEELKNTTDIKSDQVERTIKAVEDNPVDRSQLSAAHDAKSKQLLVQSAGYMLITGVYNAKAVQSARQLTSLRPGPADVMSAPSIINTAKVVVTAVPAEISHTANYTGMLADFMRDNKLTAPSATDQRKLAQAQGADPAQAATILN
jgi:hypothetical protein